MVQLIDDADVYFVEIINIGGGVNLGLPVNGISGFCTKRSLLTGLTTSAEQGPET